MCNIKKIAALLLLLMTVLFSGTVVYAQETDDPGAGRLSGKYVPAEFYAPTDNPPSPLLFSAKAAGEVNSPFKNIHYMHSANHEGCQILNGIDVSSYQPTIDWNKAKSAGVEFAIIRVAFRGYGSAGNLVTDTCFSKHATNAIAAGIPIGVYIFSQAVNEAEAREEAQFVLDRIGNYNIQLPVVLDYEYAEDINTGALIGRLYNAHLSKVQATAVCNAFCAKIAAAGYTPMVYANKSMLTDQLNAADISSKYKIWLAQYSSTPTFYGDYDFWQYSKNGSVYGISGDVDCDFWYAESYAHEIDTNYPINFTATAKWHIDVINENHSDPGNYYISEGDVCTIHEVYTDGCCKVTYPSTASGTATYFAHISDFNYIAQPTTPPTNVSLTKNQNWYDLQDTIELTPHADNATSYWMSIVKNDQPVVSCAINGTYSITANQLGGIGTYYAWISATNNIDSVESAFVEIPIVGVPGYSDVYSKKNVYSIDDTVELTVSTVCAKSQFINIDKIGGDRVVAEDCASTFTCSASSLGVGKYSACFFVTNGSGSIETKRVEFGICDAAPNDVSITMNQYWYDIQDTIIVMPDSSQPAEYYVSIMKDDKKVVDGVKVTDRYSISAEDLGGYGNYYVWTSAKNPYGSQDAQGISFKVVGKPGYNSVSSSKSLYSTNDQISISVETVCAKGQIINIDRIGGSRVVATECDSTYTCAASTLGEGDYSACFCVYNGSGAIETERISFSICDSFSITYDANGGGGTPDNQTKDYGTALILSNTKPTKTYTIAYNANGGSVTQTSKNISAIFKNWKATNGATYNPGDSYTANEATTLTAQWENPTAGTLAIPTKTGYTFDGWYTAAIGGTKITSSSTISANKTLYAQWVSERIPGDVNNDGEVTTMDATLIKRRIVGGYDIPTFIGANADVNGDGQITTLDATLIKRSIVGGYDVVLV